MHRMNLATADTIHRGVRVHPLHEIAPRSPIGAFGAADCPSVTPPAGTMLTRRTPPRGVPG